MRGMDLDAFRGWLRRYFAAWASNDPVEVSSLFAVDAVYSYGPFREETRGRAALVGAGGGGADRRVGGPRGGALARVVPRRCRRGGGVGRDLGLQLRPRRPVRPAPR